MNPQNFDFYSAIKAGYSPQEIMDYLKTSQDAGVGHSDNIFNGETPQVSENFGQPQDIEVFSNGMTYGTGLAVPEGTPVKLPPGSWKPVESYYGDEQAGQIGDSTNRGYGNSALVENTQTGERLRFSHLKENFIPQGDYTFQGGTPIGTVGTTGNTTGPHLNLEYYDQNGNMGDVLQSPYSQYLGVDQSGGGN